MPITTFNHEMKMDLPGLTSPFEENNTQEKGISTYIHNNIHFENQPVGYLGSLKLEDNTKYEACNLILSALSDLTARGIKYVFGPINVSTWHSHSYVTWSNDEVPYFRGEAQNDPRHPEYFMDCGFLPVKRFYSRIDEDITKQLTLNKPKHTEYTSRGYKTRTLDKENLETELEVLYNLSLETMNRNWGFCPITFDEFKELHLHKITMVESEYIHFVLDPSGDEVGFIIALPYHDKFIIHSMGIKEGHKETLSMLIYDLFMKMILKGYSSAIYANLENSKEIKNTLNKSSRAFREYTLFGRAL